MEIFKKSIGVAFILVAIGLIGFLVFKSFALRKNNEQSPVLQENLNKESAGLVEKSKQNLVEKQKNRENLVEKEVTGNIESIQEKTLTVKNPQETVVVNINGATPVMLFVNTDKKAVGQMADLKLGDPVKVLYDETTKNAMKISVTKS